MEDRVHIMVQIEKSHLVNKNEAFSLIVYDSVGLEHVSKRRRK